MKTIPMNERIIFALDVADGNTAYHWIDRLGSQLCFFKVGLELFLKEGLGLVQEIIARGHKVMLDLKLYDVPTTVARAVAQLDGYGISLLTIHGDSAIIKAATQVKTDMSLLAVTVLTSLDERGVKELGMTLPLIEVVEQKARVAVENGCAGVVASANEASHLRRVIGEAPLIVSPGIRLAAGSCDDQKRVATVADAQAAGVDYMVIGRPIRDAKDPIAVVAKIFEELR